MIARNLSKILTYIVIALVGLYAAIVLLLSLPAVQSRVAGWGASLLSDKFGAKVEIGSVNIGFWNRVIVDDIALYEPSGHKMATIARVSASIDLLALASSKIVVNAAQLFGVNATLYKDTPEAAPNFQFIVDALKGNDDESKPIDLKINSFIMRRANIRYDVKSETAKKGTLDTNHLALLGCGLNLALHFVTDDSLSCTVKRMQAFEAHSGLKLKNTELALSANQQNATIATLHVEMPQSSVDIDSLHVEYATFKENKNFKLGKTRLRASVMPSDITPLLDQLGALDHKVDIAATIEGNQDEITIDDFTATYGDFAACDAAAFVLAPLSDSREINADIKSLTMKTEGVTHIAQLTHADSTMMRRLAAIGDVDYKGNILIGSNIASNGALSTDAGDVRYDFMLSDDKTLQCEINADSIAVGRIVGDDDWGKTSLNLVATAETSDSKILTDIKKALGELSISSIEYKGYKYQNILVDATYIPEKTTVPNCLNAIIEGTVNIDDSNVALSGDFCINDAAQKAMVVNLDVERFAPYNLQLIDSHKDETLSLRAMANLEGKDFNTLQGSVEINDLCLATPAEQYDVKQFCINANQSGNTSRYNIDSDFLDASIEGHIRPTDLAASITNILSHHLPEVVKATGSAPNAEYDYNVTLRDCALLRHFANIDYALEKPMSIKGHVNTPSNELTLSLAAPEVEYSGMRYSNVALKCNSSEELLGAELSVLANGDDNATTQMSVVANAHDNTIRSAIDVAMDGSNRLNVNLKPVVTLSDSLGKLRTLVTLKESYANINDTLWTILPSTVSIHEKTIACRNIRCVSSAGSSITIDGALSSNANDSIVANLSDVEIKYILQAVNFTAVHFAGKASGKATVKGLLSDDKRFDLNAHLNVKDFTLQDGSLGDADIYARWNRQNESIDLSANFIDRFTVPIELTDAKEEVTGITTLNGWISPAKNDMRLDILTNRTNADFIYGFLNGVFTDVNGTLSGPVSVVGLSPVNLIGKPVADISFKLRATNVPYRIDGDTVVLQPDLIALSNATLLDKYGNKGLLQAKIQHHNLKNFRYDIHADMDGLCAYEETEFNSDKFFATLFAKGDIDINGSDGHPLRINADVTPVRGSVFAYDAATPDAIIGNTFVEFRDREEAPQPPKGGDAVPSTTPPIGGRGASASPDYRNDIYFNANIHLTPDCEVKLRMDNIEDGYMRTFGYANLNAQWHNKGSFQLFGNYDIQEGSYRLYLQNLIFRDLALQPASSVVFNGNPFDAAIHLVCHHSIPSVPLSDLTSTKAFSQNNKVRVNCILDITGYLESMDFKFDMELPNVSDEVRQLARSMINSEEEMNTQMIYLLGFGRFYPSEYARSEGNTNSDQAVNSLLSSTLSGQINQLLSNMIGQNSNWNFGSSLSTGENGWDDLDVEGVLSGRLFNERLLLNGNFGYRDNALTNQANFIGDFEVKLKLTEQGNLYVKAYNQANDRYFTKATLNTQGLGLSWQLDFNTLLPKRTTLRQSKHNTSASPKENDSTEKKE